MEPKSYSFEALLNSVHKEGTSVLDYNKMKIPCVLLKNERYDEIVKAFYGKSLVVDSNLNILHDDKKNVFVEILLKSSAAGIEQKVLLFANTDLDFFENLAKCGIIGLLPASLGQAAANILMIQLPRIDSIAKALDTIKSYLK